MRFRSSMQIDRAMLASHSAADATGLWVTQRRDLIVQTLFSSPLLRVSHEYNVPQSSTRI